MKKYIVSLIMFPLLICSFKSHSMIVEDFGVLAQNVIMVGHMVDQIKQVKNQLEVMERQKMLMEQAQLTLSGNQYQWSNAQDLINKLGTIVNQSNALSYASKNIDEQFKKNFPGYHVPNDYGQSYEDITNTTINTLNGALKSVGMSAEDFQNENRRLSFLQSQEQNADNQLKAIQAASQIASEQVTQIQLLRQTIMAQTNAQTTYYAAQIQKESNAHAELQAVIREGAKESPEIGHSGHSITIPSFNN